MTSIKDNWQKGLPKELEIWGDWLSGETGDAEDRALRLSSNRPFPWWAKPLIPGQPGRIRVLDVGAGPLTVLGNVWDDKTVTIVPIDPLATEYDELLRKNGLTPPVRTIYGMAESLSEQFEAASFDFAYAGNCLDQTIDPIAAHREIFKVLRPNSSLISIHLANQGEEENYEGVYQWNFSLKESRLIVWNHSAQYDLLDECPEIGHHHFEKDGQYIKMTLTKGA
ncbi:methyltransferase domain-containing protein [Puniceicoccales bacterium CK1056]|uniref:Methyltransferase domain-containing protein n=1 Tax=Oceanipulchritudo coccoides TaxID=2706888 RepID=A0A6B2M0E4_9BACT|nr:methyltransferase domain-containing protein [Oceanipulchritudo coccoides]NDV61220.1 methyltransferase domain-containing protein [Oceanipulchritudo coccoides]